MTAERRPIRSTILLYLANLPADQPVAWGQRIAADLRKTKFGSLSPHTVYAVLEDFRKQGLAEPVNPQPSPPPNAIEASVTTMSDAERKRLDISGRLLRAGWTKGDLEELDERHRKRGGLAGLKPREVRALVQRKRDLGFRPVDSRARGYRLTPRGRMVAALLKQPDLLAQWWTCHKSPTDNADFVVKLGEVGLGREQVEEALRAGILEQEEGAPQVRRERYLYAFQMPGSITETLRKLRRRRYRLR